LVVVTVSVKLDLHAAQTLVRAVRVLAPRAMRSGTGLKKIVRKKMTPEAAPLDEAAVERGSPFAHLANNHGYFLPHHKEKINEYLTQRR
jgi:hypothetical protein